jgi:3-phenylpropionate/trans-cinnamate dioxygenase ferredoxin reductase component
VSTEQVFVIVGGGLAGAKAAQTLREEGFDGRVVLLGEESEPPYERPPLSKGYLLGKDERASIYVHDPDWYEKNSVEQLLGRRVTRLDRAAHKVGYADGAPIPYTKLLLATGASPRRLTVPGADLAGVFSLRRVGDTDRLVPALREGGRVTVVGGGWIGLETAAAAREYGCEVTVVEPHQAPLQAALGPRMGGFFAATHRRHGVDLRLGSSVSRIEGRDDDAGRVGAVVTSDGTHIPTDIVIVGIGAVPDTELAERAGLRVDNGVLVDASLRTEDPDIYAAGDVANAFHPLYAHHIRVEHWANALNAGPAAARAMLGQPVSHDHIPYFFTDQYEIGMEYCGWFAPGQSDAVITRGDEDAPAFQAFWLAGDRVVAGMHVNMWDDGIGPIEELIRRGGPVDPGRLADPAVPLAEVTAG